MKIGLTGASGTGKTTLAKALADKYDLKIITNVARSSPGADLGMLTTNSQKSNQFIIMHTLQFWSEQDNIVSDRTVLDAYLYTRNLSNLERKYAIELVKHNLRQYDLIIYCPWFNWSVEDEGVRNLDPDYQRKFDNDIEDKLLEFNDSFDYIYVDNSPVEERMNIIHEHLISRDLI